ncbi:MAG: copper resistance protein CopC/CopD [Chloroflexi bacterium]|nr:copper resistance protein CopC/CopD [Chloroflexota bacterium]
MRRRFISLIILILLFAATPVSAHPIVIRTDPADGATLDAAPRQLSVWFTEAILIDFTTVELYDGTGRVLPVKAIRLAADDATALQIDLPELGAGAYRLTWRTLADDDFHVVAGAIVFGVQQAVSASGEVTNPTPGVIELGLRWLNQIALMIVIGAFAINSFVLPTAAQRARSSWSQALTVRRQLLRLAQWASVLAVCAGLGMVAYQMAVAASLATASAIDVITAVLGTSYGTQWLLRSGLLIVLLAVIIRLLPAEVALPNETRDDIAQLERFSTLPLAASPLLISLVVSQALHSHAAASETAPLPGLIADVVHLLAASLWVGGLIALVMIVVRRLRGGAAEAALARSLLRQFGGVAAGSAAALTITGLYNTGQLVASLDALITTNYGWALMIKLALVGVIGVSGLLNSAALHARVNDGLTHLLHRRLNRSPRQLRRTLLLEAAGGLLLLIAVAWLTASQPARGPEFDPPTETISALTAKADDLLLTTSIKPNRPGQNFININVANTRRPAPAPIERVVVQLSPRGDQSQVLTLTADELADGMYQLATNGVDRSGDWDLSVTVIRSGLPDTAWATTWQVLPIGSGARPRPVVISNQPLAPVLNTLALLIVAGFVVVGSGFALKHLRLKSAALPARREELS